MARASAKPRGTWKVDRYRGRSEWEHDRESERPEMVFPFVFLSDPKMCSHKKCQLRERTAQTERKVILTEQPTYKELSA